MATQAEIDIVIRTRVENAERLRALEGEIQRVQRAVKDLGPSAGTASRGVDTLGVSAQRAETNLTKSGRAAGAADKALGNLKTAAIGAGAGIAAALITDKVIAFGRASIDAASDLEETLAKSEEVFGSNAVAVQAWADTATESFGQSEQDALAAASTFGNLFISMGLVGGGAADMSRELVELSSDLASFNNVGTEEALMAIQSALVGEVEPMRRFGVLLNAATVEAKAMELGLADANGELSEAAKVQARYAIILEQTTTAQGDFLRTSEGLANQTRIQQANIEDLQATLGQGLQPAMLEVTAASNDLMQSPLFHGGLLLFTEQIGAVTGNLRGLRTVIDGVADAAGHLDGALVPVTDRLGGTGVLADGASEGIRNTITAAIPGGAVFSAAADGIGLLNDGFRETPEAAGLAGTAVLDYTTELDRLAQRAREAQIAERERQDAIESFDLTSHVELQAEINQLFSDSNDVLVEHNHLLGEGVDGARIHAEEMHKAAEAAAEFQDEQTALTREFHRAVQAAEEQGVAISELSDQYNAAAVNTGRMRRAMEDLSSVNVILDDNVRVAADGIGHWEEELSDVEEAMRIVRDAIERTGDPTGDLAEKMGTLEEIQGRVAGGIRDDLNPAFVDSVIFRGEMQQKLDDLNQAFEDGEISEREYAEAAKAINDEVSKANDPIGTLIDNMSTLIERIGDLIDEMTDLDGTHAHPSILLEEGGTVGGAAVAGTKTAGGGSGGITQRIGDIKGRLEELDQASATPVSRLEDHASQGLDEITSKVSFLDGSVFWITANVDIGPALASIDTLSRNVPHSPAEEGPLSVEPDWNWLFEGLAAAADQWTDEALAHIKEYVSVAQSAFQALNAEIEFAGVSAEFQAGGGALPDAAFIADLTAFAQETTRAVGDAAAMFAVEFLEHTKVFADAAKSGIAVLSDAVEMVASLDGLVVDLERAKDAVSALKFITEHIVKSIGDSAAFVNATNPDGFVQGADEYAQGALSGVELIGAAAEALVGLSELEINLERAMEAASQLKFLTEHIVKSVGDSAAFVNANNPEGFVAAAGVYAESAQKGVELIAEGLDFIASLAEFEGQFNLEEAKQFASDLKFLVEHIAISIGDTARFIEAERPEGFLDAMQAFAEAVEPAVGLIGDLVDTLEAIAEHEGVDLTVRQVQDFSLALAGIARIVAEAFLIASAGWREEVNPAIEAFSEAAGDSLGLIGDALDVIEMLADFDASELTVQRVQDFALAIGGVARIIAEAFRIASAGWDEEATPAIEAFSEAAGASLGLIKDAVDAVEAITNWGEEDEGKRPDIPALAEQLADDITTLIEITQDVASRFEHDGLEAWQEFSEAAGAALDLVGSAVDAIEGMADMSELTPDHMAVFLHNWEIAMDTVEEIARITEERGLDAAEDTLEMVQTIADTLTAAADAMNAINPPSARSVGGASSGASGGGVQPVAGGGVTAGGGSSGGSGGATSNAQADIDEAIKITQAGLAQLATLFTQQPNIAGQFVDDLIEAVSEGRLPLEQAFSLLAKIPQDELVPILNDLAQMFRVDLADAILAGDKAAQQAATSMLQLATITGNVVGGQTSLAAGIEAAQGAVTAPSGANGAVGPAGSPETTANTFDPERWMDIFEQENIPLDPAITEDWAPWEWEDVWQTWRRLMGAPGVNLMIMNMKTANGFDRPAVKVTGPGTSVLDAWEALGSKTVYVDNDGLRSPRSGFFAYGRGETVNPFDLGGIPKIEGLGLLKPHDVVLTERSPLIDDLAGALNRNGAGGNTFHLTINAQTNDPNELARVVTDTLNHELARTL